MDDLVCQVVLRPNGVVLVRVPPSDSSADESLPDAVFTFRAGDPQYDYWRARGCLQNGGAVNGPRTPTTAEAF